MEELKPEEIDNIRQRLASGGVKLSSASFDAYLKMDDDLGELAVGTAIPLGFKRCGRCKHFKKFHLFNKNTGSKTNTSGNCKICQQNTSKKFYEAHSDEKRHIKQYAATAETRREYAKNRYANNKDEMNAKHKEYRSTSEGKKVAKQAYNRRQKRLRNNAGMPYTRELVIQRDSLGADKPRCYICGGFIEDTSGRGMHIDHLVPIAIGGPDCFTNVACVHITCNLARPKDARDISMSVVNMIKEASEEFIDLHPELFK